MISLDWKERLMKDTEDFIQSKLPKGDYSFEIIYNAYPQRIGTHVPKEVITLVAKKMADLLVKVSENHMDFYLALWKNKGENGRLAFVYIISKLITKKTEVFTQLLEKVIYMSPEQPEIALLLDKAFLPIMKKNFSANLQLIFKWLNADNEHIQMNAAKLLSRICKMYPEQLEPIFHKMENTWLNASPGMTKANIFFLKSLYAIDANYYQSIYPKYRNSRDPYVVEILCNSIMCHTPEMEEIIENWTHSGNAKLKKAALIGYKAIKRKK
ncbi:MAG TPA: hypothetical protein PLE74_07250 [Candidatus Cloacimonadota bacterium]|nr:hypothetical protein [Candidatus Cloacimonadota bacterium]HPT72062.1 hypothetical protein [Candidatus Cloacimonadota bacterium]